jgi:hypothetical protein
MADQIGSAVGGPPNALTPSLNISPWAPQCHVAKALELYTRALNPGHELDVALVTASPAPKRIHASAASRAAQPPGRSVRQGRGQPLWTTIIGGSATTDRLVASGVNQLKAFSDNGGPVLFGTDVGFTRVYDTSLEYELMHRALSESQVLASLTVGTV